MSKPVRVVMSDKDHNDPLEHQQGKYDRGPVLTSNFQLNKNPIYFGPGQVFNPDAIEYVEPPIAAWKDKDALIIPRVFRFIYAAKGEYDSDDYRIASSSPPPPTPPPPDVPDPPSCLWVVKRIDVFYKVRLNQHWTVDENSVWEWVYPTPVPDRNTDGTAILRGVIGYYGYGYQGGYILNKQDSVQNTNLRVVTLNGLGSEVYNGPIIGGFGGFFEAEAVRFVYMVWRCTYSGGEEFDSPPVLIGGNTYGMGNGSSDAVNSMISNANAPGLQPGENPPPR
jgi:hypothetical protein